MKWEYIRTRGWRVSQSDDAALRKSISAGWGECWRPYLRSDGKHLAG